MNDRMRTEAPKVQAIIVTWNKKDDVLQLLAQLQDIRYPEGKLSLLVVDNNSTDGTAQAIESKYPSVTLLKHSENLGGAGGFNSGMRWAMENSADAQYLWLLDNDILVDPNALAALVTVMNANPGTAICGSRIMNVDKREEVIEAGAFIDYRLGCVRSNRPEKESGKDAKSAFKVDYVAACSLLARAAHVKKLGVWREAFFIYWDDMEWGARFNRAGYDVLATNASVVYHPSWAERTADHSAVWRNYYRIRNSLWFFNNYCGEIERRLLLMRMILRFMQFAALDCVASRTALSQAYIRGIRHFFDGKYGKKRFDDPVTDIEAFIGKNKKVSFLVFIPDRASSEKVAAFISSLMEKREGVRIRMIVPQAILEEWRKQFQKAEMISYKRRKEGAIAVSDKFRIMRFLKNSGSRQVVISSINPPRIISIWGEFVAKINFEKGSVIAIERMRCKDFLGIMFYTPAFLFRALFFPPEKEKIDP